MREVGKYIYLSTTCYTLFKKERTSFCQCFKVAKVSQNYYSNVKTLVSMHDLKLIGLNNHDCMF